MKVQNQLLSQPGEAALDRSALLQGDRLLKAHQSPLGTENLLDEALNAYAFAMEAQPECALLSSRMGKVFFMKGNYEKAVQSAEKAIQQANRASMPRAQYREALREAYYIIGLIQQRKGFYKEARQSFSNALGFGIRFSACVRLALFRNCRELALSKPFSPATLSWGLQAVYALISGFLLLPFVQDRMPLSMLFRLIPRLLMAWIQEETGQNNAALTRYLGIAMDYPAIATVAMVIGEMYREKGELQQARYWFDKVVQRHPDNLEAKYHLAQLMEESEDFHPMASLYQELKRLKPNDPHVHCNLANAHYYLQDYKAAMNHYESALQLGTNPDWKAMVAQSIGNILYDYSGNPQAALAYYHLAHNFAPHKVENYIQIGMIYFQEEDYGNAELIYQKALKVAPQNPKLYSNLGYLRWLDGDAQGAIQYYQKAIRLDSGYEIPINNLGVIYLDMLGDVHHAIELFQEAISLDGNYSLAYYNLGRAYSFLDNRLEAANCFQMAQELNQYTRDLDSDELSARIQQLFDTREMELLD